MNTHSLQSYFDPRSQSHHACRDFANLNWWEKSIVGGVAATISIVALPIFGLGVFLGIATFRKLTEVFRSKRVQMKRAAQKHNAQNQYLRLPIDMHREILSHVTDAEDLKNVALGSKSLNLKVWDSMKIKATSATNTIQQLIDFAIRLDKEIATITDKKKHLIGVPKNDIKGYHRFQFDCDKWQLIADNIKKNPELAANKMEAACRLDLVEALAEYNCIENYELHNEGYNRSQMSPPDERPISQINIDQASTGLNASAQKVLKQIIEDAKATVKGDAMITYAQAKPHLKGPIESKPMLPSHSEDCEKAQSERHWEGPFLHFFMANLENGDWACNYYSRHIRGDAIHIDWLLGKREGDRIFIPLDEKKDTPDKQMILRLRQRHSRYGGIDFENLMILSLLRMPKEGNRALKAEKRKKLLEDLETAYGKESINQARITINQEMRGLVTMMKKLGVG